jgi:HEAT repeat protein
LVTNIKPKARHKREAKLLINALDGDILAINAVLTYLSSENPHLCQILQETIHDLNSRELWRKLIYCLSVNGWDNPQESDFHKSYKFPERIDQAIIEVFTQDEYEEEIRIKEAVLEQAMKDPRTRVRHAAAYVAGVRGNPEAISILDEIIGSGTKSWQLRAIKALALLDDPRCIPLLVKALTIDRDILHREARRVLQGMGPKGKEAWIELLCHPDNHIRWEAARGLGAIGDASAALILAKGLFDENYAVRWATSDILASLGIDAVPATLKAISRFPLTEPARQAAYHALHGISDPRVQMRIKSLVLILRDPGGGLLAPVEAKKLLNRWGNHWNNEKV